MISEKEFEEKCKKIINYIGNKSIEKNLYIYGAGVGGGILARVLEESKLSFEAFVDKRADSISEYLGYNVLSLSHIDKEKSYLVVSLREYDSAAVEEIKQAGLKNEDIYVVAAGAEFNAEDIVYKGCSIGRYTYGYKGLLEFFPIAKKIGRYCSINDSAKIMNNHSLDCVTTHPFLDYPLFMDWEVYVDRVEMISKYAKHFDNADYENSQIRNNKPVIIGNDVWIGSNVIILPGTVIGDGAVIGAGAIVTKDVEPYQIVGGNPARPIRKRFDDSTVDALLRIKWWEWDHSRIEDNIELFFDPDRFVSRYRESLETPFCNSSIVTIE